MRLILLPLLFLPLLACSVPSPGPEPLSPVRLRQELAGLPEARVAPQEPLSVGYPGEALFAAGAALPLPGGTAVLDPLADWLLAHPELSWRATVRARTQIGPDYDRLLAGKRAELLTRYFRNRGIGQAQLIFLAEPGDGDPLEMTLQGPEAQPISTDSSSREKE